MIDRPFKMLVLTLALAIVSASKIAPGNCFMIPNYDETFYMSIPPEETNRADDITSMNTGR